MTFRQPLLVRLAGDSGNGEDPFRLRSEDEPASVIMVEKRLETDRIAGEKQRSGLGVPEGEREIAQEQGQDFFAAAAQGFEDEFAGAELLVERSRAAGQPFSENRDIVDPAV